MKIHPSNQPFRSLAFYGGHARNYKGRKFNGGKLRLLWRFPGAPRSRAHPPRRSIPRSLFRDELLRSMIMKREKMNRTYV